MPETLPAGSKTIPHQAIGELTFREWEILMLIAQDKQNAEIETITRLKSRSILNLRNRIGEKLGLKGRNKLGQFARKNREALECWFTVFFPPR